MQLKYRCGTRQVALTVHRDAPGRFTIAVDGTAHTVDAALIDDATMQLALGNQSHVVYAVRQRTALHVWIDGELYPFMVQTGAAVDSGAHSASPQVAAPMPGKVLQVLVQPGQAVAAGDGLVIVEAMKMEHRITAAAAGTVRSVHVSSGQMVDSGALLLELEYPA